MSNGVITVPNTYNAQGWGRARGPMPFWSDANRDAILGFQIIDVTQDTNNIYIQNQSFREDGPMYYPSITASGSECIRRLSSPGTNCTGQRLRRLVLSQAPVGAPLYSYSKRTLSGRDGRITQAGHYGVISSVLTSTVKTAYSGGRPHSSP